MAAHGDSSSNSFSSESDVLWHDDSSSTETESEASSDEELELGARPYMYEPAGESDSEGSGSESDSDGEHENRMGNNDWCTCGRCHPMPTGRESICCKEVEKTRVMVDTFVLDIDCLLEHPGFASVCLDRWVLDTAYMQYRQQYGGHGLEGVPNKKYRHTAYRQLARWCWGFLGRHVRVVLPACAVQRIRDTFPAEDGQYEGFSEA